jgi:hypothetical protein
MDTDDRLLRIQKQNDELAKLSAQITEMLAEIWKALRMGPKPDYTTREIAELMRRKEFTVREWCRLGRINARKSSTMSGRAARWTVPFDEYTRLRREGLLPIRRPPRGICRY